MMSRHFAMSSELTGAIAKTLQPAQNQLFVPGSFFNQFVIDIYIYISVRLPGVISIYSKDPTLLRLPHPK